MTAISCPQRHRNPPTAVDIVIEVCQPILPESDLGLVARKNFAELQGIVLIQRKNPPFEGKWALPGGFQEWEEPLETTALREAKEETGLDIKLVAQLQVNSDTGRDPRGPVNSVGYISTATGIPKGGDDAKRAKIFSLNELPELAFDHNKRIAEYKNWKQRTTASKPYKY